MPTFAFWNTYRLGSGSDDNKNLLYEGIVAQIIDAAHDFQFMALCEVTGELQLGVATVEKTLVRATGTKGQLAYSGINEDMSSSEIEVQDIGNFMDTFGIPSWKKGGNAFTRISKRPVARFNDGYGTPIFIYHANASAKSSFVVTWVAASLAQEYNDDLILAGDLNCEPLAFLNECQQFDRQMRLAGSGTAFPVFGYFYGTPTHNAKYGATSTYDWAITGSNTAPVTVTVMDYTQAIQEMNWNANASDHLPILITYA